MAEEIATKRGKKLIFHMSNAQWEMGVDVKYFLYNKNIELFIVCLEKHLDVFGQESVAKNELFKY